VLETPPRAASQRGHAAIHYPWFRNPWRLMATRLLHLRGKATCTTRTVRGESLAALWASGIRRMRSWSAPVSWLTTCVILILTGGPVIRRRTSALARSA